NESSSLTNGSSVVSVAGKNLLPAKPCAHAAVAITNKAAAQTTIRTAIGSRGLEENICLNWNSLLSRGRERRASFPGVLGVRGLRCGTRMAGFSRGALLRV